MVLATSWCDARSERQADKPRVIFDVSAMFAGTSLNECILSGPDLTTGLVYC